jgi:hypothetical protein
MSVAGGLQRDAYDRRGARDSAVIVALTAVAFAPLFVMATDYGRWVFLWLATSAGIVFSAARHDVIAFADRALPGGIAAALARIRQASGRTSPRSWRAALLAISLFVVPLPAYLMEGCCTVRFVMNFSLAMRLVRLLFG